MRNHRRAAYDVAPNEYEGLAILPVGIDAKLRARLPGRGAAPPAGTTPSSCGEKHGYRNAQATVIAPDRHDRPRHGLRHHRHRAGLRAGQVQEARRRRLLQDHQRVDSARATRASATARSRSDDIVRYCRGAGTLKERAARQPRRAARQGLHRRRPRAVEGTLKQRVRPLSSCSTRARSAPSSCATSCSKSSTSELENGRQLQPARRRSASPASEIRAANDYCLGTMTIEGAPHLAKRSTTRSSTAPTAAAAWASVSSGHAEAHIRMMAAAQPFISGAISQDDQHAQRRRPWRTVQTGVPPELEARHQGERALPRRKQAEPAAQLHVSEEDDLQTSSKTPRRRARRRPRPRSAWSKRSCTATLPSAAAFRCAARATPKRRSSAATRSISVHGRVRGRHARRDLPRHAQGGPRRSGA